MDLLIFALIAALIAFLCIYLVDQVGLPHPINMVCKAIIVVIAIALIGHQAGVF
jgi:hypothetical protein